MRYKDTAIDRVQPTIGILGRIVRCSDTRSEDDNTYWASRYEVAGVGLELSGVSILMAIFGTPTATQSMTLLAYRFAIESYEHNECIAFSQLFLDTQVIVK